MKTSDKKLLIGNPDTVFPCSADTFKDLTICESILGGIEYTKRQQFNKIFVVLSSIQGRVLQALSTLRKNNPQAALVLLVKMLEEPLAISFLQNTEARRPLIDDYLICPVRPEALADPAVQYSAEGTLANEKELAYQKRIRELEMLATQDDLTGLKNRRYLNQFLRQILSLAKQYRFNVTMLIFDIDNFKQYNDLYGHAVGDNVLFQAGKMIRHCCRRHDVVARVGGDEFIVVFWDLPDVQKHSQVSGSNAERRKAEGKHPREPLFMAERFRKEIEATRLPFLGPHGQGKLTISGGLASFPDDGKTAEELSARADEALLEAKRKGKNKVVIVGDRNNQEGKKTPIVANPEKISKTPEIINSVEEKIIPEVSNGNLKSKVKKKPSSHTPSKASASLNRRKKV